MPAGTKPEVEIPVEDRWDQLTLVKVWQTQPGVDLRVQPLSGGPFTMANDRRVWVTSSTELVDPVEPTRVPVGAFMQYVIPPRDDLHGTRPHALGRAPVGRPRLVT